jgi:hypothetical protein
MPHVLWELQGVQTAKFVEENDPHEAGKKSTNLSASSKSSQAR